MTTITPEALWEARECLKRAQKQAADAIRVFARWEIEIDQEAKGTLELAYQNDRRLLRNRGTRGMRSLVSQSDSEDHTPNAVTVAIAKAVLDILEPGTVEKRLRQKAETERARRKKDTERIIYHALADHVREFGADSALEMNNFALESLEHLRDIPAGMRAALVPTNVVPLNRRHA